MNSIKSSFALKHIITDFRIRFPIMNTLCHIYRTLLVSISNFRTL